AVAKAAVSKTASSPKTGSPKAPAASSKSEEGTKKGRIKKKKKGNSDKLMMSPLMLPKAATPIAHLKPKARVVEGLKKKGLKKASNGKRIEADSLPAGAKAKKEIAATSSKGKKRKVAFDLDANKVVKFKGRQPVASGKSEKASGDAGKRRTALKKKKF
ncbi:unnamed protein product, partial [Polarella glacialis]